MAEKKKFPNPQFFRARNNMDWKKQAENLKEFGSIALDLLKETDWKAFAAKQKDHLLDNVARVTREAKTIAAMTGAERMDLLKNGEKHLGTLYRKVLEGIKAADVLAACREKGLLVLTAKTRLRLLPPLTLTAHDVEMALDILGSVLAEMDPSKTEEQA